VVWRKLKNARKTLLPAGFRAQPEQLEIQAIDDTLVLTAARNESAPGILFCGKYGPGCHPGFYP
jgi:hypothetical protein